MLKFDAGQVCMTPAAAETIPQTVAIAALARHLNGDWGDVSREDKAANNRALQDGDRLLSAYHAPDNTRFWIITEADRSYTTILLPHEY